MSINDLLEKVKSGVNTPNSLYRWILLVVVASIFFGLGRLSVLEESQTPLRIQYANEKMSGMVAVSLKSEENATPTVIPTPVIDPTVQNQGGGVIGSKSGKKYYFPWCGTIKRVKPENQVPFASIADARKAGYLPAKNCKGLE
ncbi:MAG: hypothetical protein V4473_00245 [Patescibacteria group bacterium]